MINLLKFIILFCLINLFNLLLAFFGKVYFQFDIINSFIALVIFETIVLFYEKETR